MLGKPYSSNFTWAFGNINMGMSDPWRTRARRVYLAVSGNISGGILDSITLAKQTRRNGEHRRNNKKASTRGTRRKKDKTTPHSSRGQNEKQSSGMGFLHHMKQITFIVVHFKKWLIICVFFVDFGRLYVWNYTVCDLQRWFYEYVTCCCCILQIMRNCT